MRVFIIDIQVIEDRKYGGVTFKITGQLQSGLRFVINDLFYDLRKYVNHHVEMLLCVLRSPYAEYEKGMDNSPFIPEEHYSMELIDELGGQNGLNSESKNDIILNGEFIDSYVVPEKWIPLMEPRWFGRILKEPSAIKTEEGIFLFYPFHMKRKTESIENFPKNVTIVTGCIDLAAWHPLQ